LIQNLILGQISDLALPISLKNLYFLISSMKLKELMQELEVTQSYEEFKEQYPHSFLTAGFFILSQDEKEGDKFQLDFFIPKENKIASFEYPFTNFKLHEDEIREAKEMSNLDLKVDLTDIKQITKKVLGQEFTKIIAIMQNEVWNMTCLSGITIKRMKINAYTQEIIEAGDLALNDVMRFKKK
jgi:hypothetical protein